MATSSSLWTAARAHDLAIEALAWIAQDPELVEALVDGCGMSPQALHGVATDPDLALALLDFVLEDDARVTGLARQAGLRPEAVMQARTVLAGPGSAGWSAD